MEQAVGTSVPGAVGTAAPGRDMMRESGQEGSGGIHSGRGMNPLRTEVRRGVGDFET